MSVTEQEPIEVRSEPAAPALDAPADEYAVVEIFGHRRHVGRILEVERFGAKMLRVDVPNDGDFDKGYISHFYAGGSIFGLTPCDLAAVQRAGRRYVPPALSWQGRDDSDVDARGDDVDHEIA